MKWKFTSKVKEAGVGWLDNEVSGDDSPSHLYMITQGLY